MFSASIFRKASVHGCAFASFFVLAACSSSESGGLTDDTNGTPSTGGTANLPDGPDTPDDVDPPPVSMNPPDDKPDQKPPVQVPPDKDPPGNPPTLTCNGELPASFTSTCNGCHTKDGVANSRYPDLFLYKKTLDDFKAQVRKGGNGMAAYSDTIIADSDIAAIYAYFTGSDRTGLEGVDLGGVVPLFKPADAVNPPIVFTRDDGVLVTRGSGRVRGRHEGPQASNEPFMEFVVNYFQDRSYGFIVEDFTPTGKSEIHVSYLPNGYPTGGTNFRAWKNYNNGDVFSTNGGMQGDAELPSLALKGEEMNADYETRFGKYAAIQQGVTTTNTREGRAIQEGDLFEFEFGIFFNGGEIQPPGSRTAYYTDTYRYNVGKGGLTSNSPDPYGGDGKTGPAPAAQLGGDTTNVWPYHLQETFFSQMALNIQHENVQNFLEGRRLFHTDFETGVHSEEGNPPFPEQAAKAGPMLATTSCESCHINNGAGEMLKGAFDETASMAIKLYGAGDLGTQLQIQEGTVTVTGFDEKQVELADGTSVKLSKPQIEVTPNSGTVGGFSARIARKLIGMGLLEAIDERTLIERADPGDCDGNGISGRPNYVADPVSGALRMGRFGWKSEKVSVAHQVADALDGDIGVSTSIIPGTDSTPELNDVDLAKLTTYMRLVSVPGQRDFDQPQVMQGEQIFKTIGCSNCHATDVVTGSNHPFAELRNQSIKPYTDLLLHDMGADLADNSGIAASDDAKAPASASEWRTPPLWGIGLLETVNGHTGLLHDGRAANVLEAVLWHGGEAQAVKEKVMALSTADREALLAFVQSL